MLGQWVAPFNGLPLIDRLIKLESPASHQLTFAERTPGLGASIGNDEYGIAQIASLNLGYDDYSENETLTITDIVRSTYLIDVVLLPPGLSFLQVSRDVLSFNTTPGTAVSGKAKVYIDYFYLKTSESKRIAIYEIEYSTTPTTTSAVKIAPSFSLGVSIHKAPGIGKRF